MPPPPLRTPVPTPVKAFLSCSVRARDKALVDAIARMVTERGFHCHTIGRNDSRAAQADDAVKQLMDTCDCLIGIATTRHLAHDVDRPSETLHLATPYLVQEAGAAHQMGLPFVMFKVGDVVPQGITNRNLWFEVKETPSPSGKVLVRNKAAMDAALGDLYAQALAKQKQRARNKVWNTVKNIATGTVAVVGGVYAADYLGRPGCFGLHDGRVKECKACSYAPKCRTEKFAAAAGL